jgi:hypothetical protein
VLQSKLFTIAESIVSFFFDATKVPFQQIMRPCFSVDLL